MEAAGSVLIILGIALMWIGIIWLLIVAFFENVMWVVGSILLPPVGLIFVLSHWRKAWKPFLVKVVGFGCALAGIFMGGTI